MRQARRGGGLLAALLAHCRRRIGYSAFQSKNVLYGLELLRK